MEEVSGQNQIDDALYSRNICFPAEAGIPCTGCAREHNPRRLRVGKQCFKLICSTTCALAATRGILLRPSGRDDPASVVPVVVADDNVLKMQNGLGQMLTGNCWRRQFLQRPVQIVGKKASRSSLKRREVGTMLLRILAEKGAKNAPWIAIDIFAVATRLSTRDYVGAEWIASQIGITPEQFMPCCAVEKREVRSMRETSHGCDRLNPL
ncbi:hypothetical protein ACVIGB_008510 [Bradyrhizobium sp. USDA 4341]